MPFFGRPPKQQNPHNAAALYRTVYVKPSRTHYPEITSIISDAVAALNNLTDASINAWDAVKIAKDNHKSLSESEAQFFQSLRDLALKLNPKTDAFERIQIETEFNETLRQRQVRVSSNLSLMISVTDQFRKVDSLREPCKQVVKSLDHEITMCERAGLSEGKILGGSFLLYVGLGGDAPLPQPRFQYGGGRDYHVLTLSIAKKLRDEMKRRMEIVHSHYLQCLQDIPDLCKTSQEAHNQKMKEIDGLRDPANRGVFM